MTRSEAVTKLKKLFGEKLYYRVGRTVTSPEKREAARAEHACLSALHLAAKALRDARSQAVLAADTEYQRLKAEAASLYKDMNSVEGRSDYRFAIGRNIGWANVIEAEGDTWEECFAKVEGKGKAVSNG